MFQKIAVTTGKTSPHLSRLVRELLRKNKNLWLIYLPKNSSYLNVIEESSIRESASYLGRTPLE